MNAARLGKGDPVPWIAQDCPRLGRAFPLEALAGRHVFFCFPADPPSCPDAIAPLLPGLDGFRALVVVWPDGSDAPSSPARPPGPPPEIDHPDILVLSDTGRALARAFGVSPSGGRSVWFVANPRLKLLYAGDFATDAMAARAMIDLASYLPADLASYNPRTQPPVLTMEAVLEPGLCARLIAGHLAGPRRASPALTVRNGETIAAHDAMRKSRTDSDPPPDLRAMVEQRVTGRIAPELERAFQFRMTAINRMTLGCYEAADGGRFEPHRDNTLPQTRHRRFAVSINLNDEYDGGYIGFPEYSGTMLRPPATGAIAFSCSLQHVVTTITRGRRFALLLFLT